MPQSTYFFFALFFSVTAAIDLWMVMFKSDVWHVLDIIIIIMIIIIIFMSGEPRAQRAIGHTQVRLQPEPGADMHRLAALSTRKCTLAAFRSTGHSTLQCYHVIPPWCCPGTLSPHATQQIYHI